MDLFENYNAQPPTLRKVCDFYSDLMEEQGYTYTRCEEFLKQVEKLGYTFEYGLDAMPCNLRPNN
jgi:hypothetical protein